MINRIVCKALLVSDWKNHGAISTARVGILDTAKNNPRTVWIKIKAFKKTAELLEKYTSKGDVLFVDGRLDMEIFENKEGKKQYEYSIVIDKAEWSYKDNKPTEATPDSEEDIPF